MKIGIIGAGQLGRMLALAGYPLGQRFVFLDKSTEAPGGQVGDIILGEFSDPERIGELAKLSDLLTFDVENVPADAVRSAVGDRPFYPPVEALEAAQDRLNEKRLFTEHGIPTPPFMAIDTRAELEQAVASIGLPCVLKTRRLGYDGKGQFVLRAEDDIARAWDKLGGVPLILEGFVPFEREVSVIGVRRPAGEQRFYPIAENTHREGILRHSVAPYDDAGLQREAESYCERLMTHFGYVGVLTIEFFVHEGRLLANEIAPRVHNSGHWTIEGAVTSQFENHVRAILDLPLGETAANGYAAMVNFIGTMPPLEAILAIPGVHQHDYGKTPRPGRKLGHATLTSASRGELLERLEAVLDLAG